MTLTLERKSIFLRPLVSEELNRARAHTQTQHRIVPYDILASSAGVTRRAAFGNSGVKSIGSDGYADFTQ